MSLPLELEQAFTDLHREVVSNHKGIRKSLSRLRTLVVGHYDDVNKFAKGIEHEVVLLKREHASLKTRVAATEEKLGIPPVPTAAE